jgi:hypothetical protein
MYLVVEESLAYLGFVQENATTFVSESAGVGFVEVTLLLKTGALPVE